VLRLSGRNIRDALAKGCLIDLHPRAFRPGDVALTSIAHISVQLWVVDEATFELAVPRSMAMSFWSWLRASAAPYGVEVAATASDLRDAKSRSLKTL
jgi:sarcosine oxidase subunit gamma